MSLGYGDYEAFLFDRGGKRPIGRLQGVEVLAWTRTRDEISEARVTIRGAKALSNLVESARTVRHELVITRNGQRVWEGPLTRIEYDGQRVEFDAKDILWFASRSAVRTHYNAKKPYPKVIDVAYGLLKTVYDKNNDWLNAWDWVERYHSTSDWQFGGEWVGYSETVHHVLERLAEDWDLDYATVGRRIYLNDVHTRFAYTHALTDEHFLGPIVVTEYGADLETVRYSTGTKKVWTRTASQALMDYYGPIESVRPNNDENAEAPALPPVPHWDKPVLDIGPAPVRIRVPDNTQISPEAPVTIDQLVAGAWIPVRTQRLGRPFDAWTKIDQVNVNWTPPGGERIDLVLSAAPSGGMVEPL